MLDVKRLSKSYRVGRSQPVGPRAKAGLFHALRAVSFRAQQGSVVGVLGPNGAGKTTLMRLLSTALRPSSGTAVVAGVDVVRRPGLVRRRLGFLSGTTGLYGRLTAREMVTYYAQLHGLASNHVRIRVDALLDELELNSVADRRCDALSTGMAQRVSIARTLVHDPDLLVFDEPTTGLDVAAADRILALLEERRAAGKTVLLSTHHLHEVERLCDRVVLLGEGRLVFDGTVEAMRHAGGGTTLEGAFLRLVRAGEGEVDRAA